MKTLIQSIFVAIVAIIIFGLNSCEETNSTTESKWVELGGTNTSTFDGAISSIATDISGNLYVGGELFNINKLSYVAKWNKSTNSWSVLGGTNTSSFNAGFRVPIATDIFGNVYVCGITRIPNQNDDFHVAKWDGSSWSELGGTNQPSFNNLVHSIATDASGNVYASGDYIDDGNNPFVAKWNKSTNSWSVIGSFNGYVSCMTTDALDNVYAGGEFLNINVSPHSSYVAKWDGTNWSELGGTNVSNFGISEGIYTVAIDVSGNVYAGGCFYKNNILKNIVKWDKITNTWNYLNNLPSHDVSSIVIDVSSNVYATGGLFVAKWDGTNWSDFGNLNANSSIYSICIDASGNIYAGGAFTNGKGNNYIAVYYK